MHFFTTKVLIGLRTSRRLSSVFWGHWLTVSVAQAFSYNYASIEFSSDVKITFISCRLVLPPSWRVLVPKSWNHGTKFALVYFVELHATLYHQQLYFSYLSADSLETLEFPKMSNCSSKEQFSEIARRSSSVNVLNKENGM